MKQLELKDLKHYLGTGLKFLTCYNIECNPVIEEMALDYLQSLIDIPIDEKPLMLSLSALTEQLPDGSIPIVELAKIMYPKHSEWRLSASGHYAVIRNGYMTFEFDSGNNCFLINNSGIMDQSKCYEYLYQHHFWLGDQSLFETGEIIDKRTLK